MDFMIHTIDSASDDTKAMLEHSKQRYKFIPNLHGIMAESPVMLEAYKALGTLYAKTDMTVLERQVVLLAINYENECHYCMAAHSVIAQMEKMPPEILTALRDGKPLSDANLETLRSFAAKMTRTRGWMDETGMQAMLDAGYTKRTIQEVIVAIAYKVVSNYQNHLAETEVDEQFKSQAWSKPGADAA
ncbi:MAG: carboxymuconolactone decarboxylase family protein [Pseudomonadota bacterium]